MDGRGKTINRQKDYQKKKIGELPRDVTVKRGRRYLRGRGTAQRGVWKERAGEGRSIKCERSCQRQPAKRSKEKGQRMSDRATVLRNECNEAETRFEVSWDPQMSKTSGGRKKAYAGCTSKTTRGPMKYT